jgi:small subunit ribosomal protein S6
MNNYEVLYVIDGTLSDEAIKEQVAKFSELVIANGGEVVQVDEWGKRRLAYQINYKSEGYYVLMNFKSAPEFPAELERNFGINEGIMRYMVERKSDDYVPAKKTMKPKAAPKAFEEKPADAEEVSDAETAPAEEAPAEVKEETPEATE